jgi:biotin synthase
MNSLIAKALECPGNLDRSELIELLSLADTDELFSAAYGVKLRYTGRSVFLRGIIEFSNYCAKDCLYCGIRKSNRQVRRYRLSEDDIVRMAAWAYEQQYGSIVLQSGELETEENASFIERVLKRIDHITGGELGVTLSLGEQPEAVLRRWRDAGAHRYLLRIETSNPELYARLHPAGHSFERRVECLRDLKRLGYQTGSGVMIGLPGQTLEDLAADVEFFRSLNLDMIGMGPYIPHHQTPLGEGIELSPAYAAAQLQLGLKMIAVTRLYLHDVNIAATTALQALDDRGREQGLLAGANVIMPNVTDTEYRSDYQLYENKPCLDENAAKCRNCLNWRVLGIRENISWGERGDPVHFANQEVATS